MTHMELWGLIKCQKCFGCSILLKGPMTGHGSAKLGSCPEGCRVCVRNTQSLAFNLSLSHPLCLLCSTPQAVCTTEGTPECIAVIFTFLKSCWYASQMTRGLFSGLHACSRVETGIDLEVSILKVLVLFQTPKSLGLVLVSVSYDIGQVLVLDSVVLSTTLQCNLYFQDQWEVVCVKKVKWAGLKTKTITVYN